MMLCLQLPKYNLYYSINDLFQKIEHSASTWKTEKEVTLYKYFPTEFNIFLKLKVEL